MSWKAPALTVGSLISSTMPSKPIVASKNSALKRFMKVTCAAAEVMGKSGEVSSVVPGLPTLVTKASLGALLGLVVEVVHAGSDPVVATVQPAGRAGAVTPSKFSEQAGRPPGAPGLVSPARTLFSFAAACSFPAWLLASATPAVPERLARAFAFICAVSISPLPMARINTKKRKPHRTARDAFFRGAELVLGIFMT